jgi:hypothetical protein
VRKKKIDGAAEILEFTFFESKPRVTESREIPV